MRKYKIAVAGTGYVGLSVSCLLAVNNSVTAVDIIKEKIDLINNKKSPIQDDYIEKYLVEKNLDLARLTAQEPKGSATSEQRTVKITAVQVFGSRGAMRHTYIANSPLSLVL